MDYRVFKTLQVFENHSFLSQYESYLHKDFFIYGHISYKLYSQNFKRKFEGMRTEDF